MLLSHCVERRPMFIQPQLRHHGGVVTQRIANPCTPVRFRVVPPYFLLGIEYTAELIKKAEMIDKEFDIIIFGATSFVGQIMTRHI